MSNSTFYVGLVVAAVAAAGAVAYTVYENPVPESRESLEYQLDAIRPVSVEYGRVSAGELEKFATTITTKPALWKELVPPPPKAKPKPKPPDLAAMLKGVQSPRRVQVGDRIQIITSESRGQMNFYGVGDEVRGLTIKEITADSVIFSLTKDGKEYTHTLSRS